MPVYGTPEEPVKDEDPKSKAIPFLKGLMFVFGIISFFSLFGMFGFWLAAALLSLSNFTAVGFVFMIATVVFFGLTIFMNVLVDDAQKEEKNKKEEAENKRIKELDNEVRNLKYKISNLSHDKSILEAENSSLRGMKADAAMGYKDFNGDVLDIV